MSFKKRNFKPYQKYCKNCMNKQLIRNVIQKAKYNFIKTLN